MGTSSRQQEVDFLPWDPIWDYMLNDEELDDMILQEEESNRRDRRTEEYSVEETDRGILGCLVPGDETRDDLPRDQQRKQNDRGRSRRFWRRGRHDAKTRDHEVNDEADEEEMSSQASGFAKWMKGARSGKSTTDGTSIQTSIQEERERQVTRNKVEDDSMKRIGSKSAHSVPQGSVAQDTVQSSVPEESGFFPFGGLLDVWGVSSSEDSSDGYTYEGETSYATSHASEEGSLVTEDVSLIDDASSVNAEKPREDSVTEVLLKFQPGSSSRLSSMFEMDTDSSEQAQSDTSDASTDPETVENTGSDNDETEKVKSLEQFSEAVPAMNNPPSIVDPIIQSASDQAGAGVGTKKCINPRGSQSAMNLRPGRVVCCSIKDLTRDQLAVTKETGIPFHELSKEDLATYFPKLRTVVDNKAEVIGNCNSFEGSLPAHLQTTLLRRGKPQSLYEYEYETGENMFVSYSSFGPSAKSLVRMKRGPELEPPPLGTINVVMQVEASTVSQTDCFIRNGFWWRLDSVPLPNIPGVDAVGKIYRIDERSSKRYGLSTGDRVMTLTKWGGNSRYLYVDPSQLVKVPEMTDPATTVCLAETYLSAFQILHYGVVSSKRYRRNSLKGKTCLILGSMDPKIGQAFSEVARFAGMKTIYASAKQKRFGQLQSTGIIPLSKDNLDWIDRLDGKIDMIISFEQEVSPLYYSLLTPDGEMILVCCGEVKVDDIFHVPKPSRMICRRSKWQQKSRTHIYDVYKEWDDNTERCKRDLQHLTDLLTKDIVCPSVLDRIPLGKVAKAQEMIEAKRLSGFLVCEPWLIAKSRALRL